MIIRSQDKKSITTDLNLKIMYRDGMLVKYKICSSKEGCIGYYSTEEKAIKVLDMIQSNYVCHKGLRYFQMPQDSEV